MAASLSPLAPPLTADRRDRYLQNLSQTLRSAVPENLALVDLRSRAAAWLQEQTFPSPRQEDWRFTDLSPLLALDLQPAPAVSAPDLPDWSDLGTPAVQLVLVNGHFCSTLSQLEGLPPGAIAGSLRDLLNQPDLAAHFLPRLAQAPGQQEVFTALNTLGFADGVGLWIPPHSQVEQPIQILYLSYPTPTPGLAQPRSLVVAEAGSQLTLVEQYGGDGASSLQLTNGVTEIWLQASAQITHIRLQREGESTFHIGKTAVMQAADSQYSGTALHWGAQLNRHHWEIYQTGPQTTTYLHGLAALRGSQHSDTHSLVALGHPHGRVEQRHRTIVDDRAHSVFNGRIVVSQAAQFTNASQINRNLLLSDQARVDTKPQLEIVADNVKCAHGATVSQLQADEIFYLQSRGLSASQAQRLLVYAFAMEILHTIPITSLREVLRATLAELSD